MTMLHIVKSWGFSWCDIISNAIPILKLHIHAPDIMTMMPKISEEQGVHGIHQYKHNGIPIRKMQELAPSNSMLLE